MLKTLLKLYFIKKKREFKWVKFFLTLYFYAIFLVVILSSWLGVSDEMKTTMIGLLDKIEWAMVVPIMAASLILPDFITKLLLKDDSAIMDNYLKTRPVKEETWNKFVMISTFFDFFNLSWSLPLAVFLFFAAPPLVALLSALLLFMVSFVNSLAVTTFRKAKGWEYKMAIIVGWLVWQPITLFHSFNIFGMGWGIHYLYFFVLNTVALLLCIKYLNFLPQYDESQNKKKKHKKFNNKNSWFFIEMRPYRRGKRLKKILFFPLIFIVQAYLSVHGESDTIDLDAFWFYFGIVGGGELILQQTFAIEGAYFNGIWSRPISVEKLLLRKYYFGCTATFVTALLMLPLLFMYPLVEYFYTYFAALTLSLGFVNVGMLTYCFTNKALDINASGKFNTQGANFSGSAFALVFTFMFAPMLLFIFLPLWVASTIMLVVGMIGIIGHRYFIKRIAQRFVAKRYKHFERFR